jgi:uncharacterized protein YjbJ (UPF0337 family)
VHRHASFLARQLLIGFVTIGRQCLATALQIRRSSLVRTILLEIRSRLMNWDTIQGKWKQYKGQVKETWGDLTDDDLTEVEGKRDRLVGAIQERYGVARDEAERQVQDFESACGCA